MSKPPELPLLFGLWIVVGFTTWVKWIVVTHTRNIRSIMGWARDMFHGSRGYAVACRDRLWFKCRYGTCHGQLLVGGCTLVFVLFQQLLGWLLIVWDGLKPATSLDCGVNYWILRDATCAICRWFADWTYWFFPSNCLILEGNHA